MKRLIETRGGARAETSAAIGRVVQGVVTTRENPASVILKGATRPEESKHSKDVYGTAVPDSSGRVAPFRMTEAGWCFFLLNHYRNTKIIFQPKDDFVFTARRKRGASRPNMAYHLMCDSFFWSKRRNQRAHVQIKARGVLPAIEIAARRRKRRASAFADATPPVHEGGRSAGRPPSRDFNRRNTGQTQERVAH